MPTNKLKKMKLKELQMIVYQKDILPKIAGYIAQ